MILMILQSIVAWTLVGLLTFIVAKMYDTITEQLGVSNAIDVAREVVGGYILGVMLRMERRTDYGE